MLTLKFRKQPFTVHLNSVSFSGDLLVQDDHCLSSMLTQTPNGTAHHAFQRMRFAAPRFLAREPKAGLRAAALGFAILHVHIHLHQTPMLLSKCSSPLHADKQWAKGQTAIQAHASQDDLMLSEQHMCSQKYSESTHSQYTLNTLSFSGGPFGPRQSLPQ